MLLPGLAPSHCEFLSRSPAAVKVSRSRASAVSCSCADIILLRAVGVGLEGDGPAPAPAENEEEEEAAAASGDGILPINWAGLVSWPRRMGLAEHCWSKPEVGAIRAAAEVEAEVERGEPLQAELVAASRRLLLVLWKSHEKPLATRRLQGRRCPGSLGTQRDLRLRQGSRDW